MSTIHERAWSDFWAQQGDKGGGCLPDGWKGTDTAQQEVWKRFAKGLPRAARVIDLATGDGRVMRWMRAVRSDLKLVGTDLAPALPAPPLGTKVRAGVAMETLPFPDGRFTAATSQFGFEYADVSRAAAEIGRVLRPGGSFALLSHRGDGPILAHNLRRRAAIRWALEEQGVVELAKRSLMLRSAGIVSVPQAIAALPAEGARRFGEGSAAWEIAEAVRRTLVLRARDTPAGVVRLLDRIAAEAANEMARITSLEAACAQADNGAAMEAAFAAAELEQVEMAEVKEPRTSRAFATYRLLRRR